MKFFIFACLLIATAFADEEDKCVDVYDECVKTTGTDPFSRFKCGLKYLKCRFSDKANAFDGDNSCKSTFMKCVMNGGGDCFQNLRQCAKEQHGTKIDCFKQCGLEANKCRKESKGLWEKLKCLKPAKDCALKCRYSDEEVTENVFYDEGIQDKCVDVYDECVKATGTDPFSRFKCGIKYLKCRLGDKESDYIINAIIDDKCVDVYDECVNATGTDPFSRFKCGIKYLKCRLGDKLGDEINMDDPNDKCVDVYDDCVKATGTDPFSRFKCGMKYLKCRLGDKFGDEFTLNENMFLGGENDKCTEIYEECVKEHGTDFWNRLKCGRKYLACRKGQVKPKIKCMKKCKDIVAACMKAKAGQCFKKGFECAKECNKA